jgi:hypothetical protein
MHDTADPSLSRLKINAVNLYYMSEFSDGTTDTIQISIDIIHQVERTAVIWQQYLTNLLRKSGMIKNKNYSSDPGNPVEVDGNVCWNVRGLYWTSIREDDYCHYNLTFEAQHYFAIT